jgi:hypothetical protein
MDECSKEQCSLDGCARFKGYDPLRSIAKGFISEKTQRRNKMQSIKTLAKLVLLVLLAIALFTPSLSAQGSAKAISYSVPYMAQISSNGYVGFSDWGQSACGPTSIAMVLRYYFPNAGITAAEVYAGATQTLVYRGPTAGYRNVGFPGSTWPGTVANTGLDNVPNEFKQYFSGSDDGMDPSYAAKYLMHTYGGNAQVLYPSVAGLITELANGPFVLNVNERNRDGKQWGGHYIVLTGYDPSTSTFSVNDPFPPFAAYYGNSPQNEKVSLATLTSWYQGRILVYRPDTSLSVNGRLYTTFVDGGLNNNGLPPNCSSVTNCFTVDSFSGKNSSGAYIWQSWHRTGMSYAYPVEGGHTAQWKPFLQTSGYYEVVLRTYTAPNSAATRYSLKDASGQELAVRYVDHNNTAVTEQVASFGTFWLTGGARVDANVAPNAPTDTVAFLDREYPSVASRPQAVFTLTTNGKTFNNNQSLNLSTVKGTPLSVAFNASSSQAGPAATISTYEWFDNNVKIGTGATPTFALNPGIHNVVLQVLNTFSLAASSAVTVSVSESLPPTAAFSLSGGGKSGSNNQSVSLTVPRGSTVPITFNASASQAGSGTLSYLWLTGNATLSTQQTFTVSLGAGTYNVSLRVTNSAGLTATASALLSITESATPPTASFTFSGGGKSGGINQTVQLTTAQGTTIPISFNGTASQAGTGALTYAWFYNNNSLTTQPSFTANFGPGTYVMMLRVTNGAGLTASASATITITATIPPTAAFTISGGGKTGANGQTLTYTVPRNGSVSITFNAGASRVGSAPIASYLWQSNGTTISTNASFTYTFGTPSNNITLRVTDTNGQSSTATAVILVKAQ